MADSRFFTHSGKKSLKEILAASGAKLAAELDLAQTFADVAPLNTATRDQVSFLDNPKYIEQFTQTKAGACFVHPKYAPRAPEGVVLLLSEEPYTAYALTAQLFYPEQKPSAGISPHAHIDPSAIVSKTATISPGAVIGKEVNIGEGVFIGANTVIHDGVVIGDRTSIGACSTISHSIIGRDCIIHRGVHIGQDGFGFAGGKTGIAKVPQLGRVLIGDDVDIGATTCIDRGAGPDTIIGDHTKIDNQVQIGHNVQIGKYVIICGKTGISGSTKILDGAVLGADVGIAGHLTIGKGAKLAARAGVMTDVPDGAIYGGTPAMPIRQWHKHTAMLNRLIQKNGTSHE